MPEQQIDPSQQMQQLPPGVLAGIIIVYSVLLILLIASMWKLFTKAGEPGWAAIVPFYNVWVGLRIAGKPGWGWFIMMCIPFVSFIAGIIALVSFVERFGKGAGYVIGIILLWPIFLPMLAFGDSKYLGSGSAGAFGQPALS
jgi:hypothetical protein